VKSLKRRWHKLDNVGKFYSSVDLKSTQKIFRYSATLKRNIDKEDLQLALNMTIKEYPSFNVTLKQGLFWHYIHEVSSINRVSKEKFPICYKIYDNDGDYLYRVSYYKKRINFELSHIVSDGLGSLEFFKLLINNYVNIRYKLNIKKISSDVSLNEKEEDSFIKNYKKNKIRVKTFHNIYNYKGEKYKTGTQYLEAHIKLNKMLDLVHEYNTSLTVFLISLLIYSFKKKAKKKIVKIDVPVNLRKYNNSLSSKNYFALVGIVYKFNKNDKLENVINSVDKQVKEELNEEKIMLRVNKMVSFEKNILCRISPLFLKNIFLKITNMFVIQLSSTCFSNVGRVEFHEDVNKYVDNVNVITNTPNFQIAICSFKNDLSINISSVFKNNDIIRNFLRFLTSNDIEVVINANEVK